MTPQQVKLSPLTVYKVTITLISAWSAPHIKLYLLKLSIYFYKDHDTKSDIKILTVLNCIFDVDNLAWHCDCGPEMMEILTLLMMTALTVAQPRVSMFPNELWFWFNLKSCWIFVTYSSRQDLGWLEDDFQQKMYKFTEKTVTRPQSVTVNARRGRNLTINWKHPVLLTTDQWPRWPVSQVSSPPLSSVVTNSPEFHPEFLETHDLKLSSLDNK